jgi:DNA repair exonuclease SbcCD ATPase subunit
VGVEAMSLISLREQVDKYKRQYETTVDILKKETRNLKKAERQQKIVEESIHHVQIVAQTVQEQAHKKISDVVTSCLQSVFFDRDYAFRLKFERKRNKTEAKPIIISEGHEIENPLDDAESGGVVDVAAFTCQISAILLSKPPIRKFMGMDEPFKFVSPEYRDSVRSMLEVLAKDFDMQFLMVTSHQSEITAGKEIEL